MRFTYAPEDLPEGVAGMGVWLGGAPGVVGSFFQSYDLKHYCERCDEVMSRAWGSSCPVCHGPIEKVFV